MFSVSFTLSQKITYWSVASVNSNSEKTWNTPVTVSARYALKDGVFVNDRGESQKTMWVIYTTLEIPKRSLIVLGTDTATTPTDGARMMMDNKSNPSFINLVLSVA